MASNPRKSLKSGKGNKVKNAVEGRIIFDEHMSAEVAVRSRKGHSLTSISVVDEDVPFRDESDFCELSKKSGLTLSSGRKANVLAVEQTKFTKDFISHLRKHPEYPQVADDILKDIQKYLDDTNRLKQALAPTHLAPTSCSGKAVRQDSIFRLFLRVPQFQVSPSGWHLVISNLQLK